MVCDKNSQNLNFPALLIFLSPLLSQNQGEIRVPHGRFGGYTCMDQQIFKNQKNSQNLNLAALVTFLPSLGSQN